MNRHLRNLLEFIAFVAVTALIWVAVPVQAHTADQMPGSGTKLIELRALQQQRDARLCQAAAVLSGHTAVTGPQLGSSSPSD